MTSMQLPPDTLSNANRPLRLRLSGEQGVLDDLLLVQHVQGHTTICGGFEYRLLCVATRAGLPLKMFNAMAAELQIVTDRGELHSVCGIVAHAAEGESDGGLATFQLVVRDALALMEARTNSRVFRDSSEVDITHVLLRECLQNNPVLAGAFDFRVLAKTSYPRREFTMQYNESDAAFLRRLWKKRGLAWFFEAGERLGSDVVRGHRLVLFDDPRALTQASAGTVRYHRDDGTEARDSITAWHALRSLGCANVTRHSWDYKQSSGSEIAVPGRHDQGARGNRFAANLDDYLAVTPHAGDDPRDFRDLATLRMEHHEYVAKVFEAESSVRDLNVGQWIGVEDHAELDTHPREEREFVLTDLRIEAENNLPTSLNDRIMRLFARNQWRRLDEGSVRAGTERGRYVNRFSCVRRGIPIVPAFDPRVDLPQVQVQSVIVVAPTDEEVHCDQHGRVKVRFPACRPGDHLHAQGAGASGTDTDSAWIRVASSWAGDHCGAISLPRAGDECLVAFLGGDPDKPVIIGRVHGARTPPPDFTHQGTLPGNRFLSGIKSREIGGRRYNQLRMDDTPGQISIQLASEHGHSQLNLGELRHARSDGKAEPRGEGAELRSDDHVAVRAAKGILLSAWKRLNAVDSQLARAEFLSLMGQCLEQCQSLGSYAAEHQAMALDAEPLAQLKEQLDSWENSSNVAPKDQGGGGAVIGLSAPEGISFATSKALVSYAGSNLDSVAQQHLQLTAGQRFNLNAGQGVSLFAHHGGIKAIAHQGKFLLQSQHDDTELNSAKNVRVTATDGKVVVMAKEIQLIAEDGSFIKIGGGITLGTEGDIKHHGAKFPFDGPATMATELPVFDKSAPDQKFVLKYGAHGEDPVAAANRRYEIALSDGSILSGTSDTSGKTSLLERDAMHIARIRILSDET
ncbi:type VI secretion system tip protein VgrG [Massilia sp. G4R7]|uniref:Type VI secretion system tip protein VgrG n=1 Tax=Massilia phyllostachyos TaxID=2898585 RepID=A0ABS8Q077_9BURK|nr:type VI secretion system Vgr family protein [Massilia phyllostachyos]MCD2515149.1 type VI secretion system tip protein VgrG [Massilia phyllostachyos]